MLADDVMAMAGTPYDAQYRGSFSLASQSIRLAQRFVLDESVTSAAVEVMRSKPSAIKAALPLCRAPYPRVWIERLGGVPGFLDATRERPAPTRLGALIECYDDTGQFFVLSIFWSFPGQHKVADWSGPKVAACGVSLAIHLTEPYPTRRPVPAYYQLEMPCGKAFSDLTQAEQAATIDLAQHGAQQPAPHMREWLAWFNSVAPKEKVRKMLDAWQQDLMGEPIFFLAALCLLNSRNLVTQTEAAGLATLNKARIKRNKLPLLSYKTVSILLSKRDQRAAKADGTSQAEIRRHLVRGHFKVRSSGVYWWRPFIRGKTSAGEVRKTRYEVGMGHDSRPAEQAWDHPAPAGQGQPQDNLPPVQPIAAAQSGPLSFGADR